MRFCKVEFFFGNSLHPFFTAQQDIFHNYVAFLCFSHTLWFTDLDYNYIMISNRLVLLVSLELDVNQQHCTIIICWYMHEMLYFVIDLIALAVGWGRLKLLTLFNNAAFSCLLNISQSTILRLSSLRLCEFLSFSLTLYTASLCSTIRSLRLISVNWKHENKVLGFFSFSARCFSSSKLKMKSALVAAVWMNMICWEIAWV